MKFTITYVFSVNCWVNENGDNDPTVHYGSRDVIYDYEVNITKGVLEDYFIYCIGEHTFKTWSKEKQEGYIRACEIIYGEDLYCEDAFLNNDNFMEWVKQYFHDDAKEECEEDYGEEWRNNL